MSSGSLILVKEPHSTIKQFLKIEIMNKIITSAPFVDVFWARGAEITSKQTPSTGRELAVKAFVPPSARVVVVGDTLALGEWDPARGVDMLCSRLPVWHVPADMMLNGDQYKFVIMEGDRVIKWEEGENRIFDERLSLEVFSFRGAPWYWPRVAGMAIPVFSIRSKGTEGIGDFLSLGEFAAWTAQMGGRVVQTLPVNDTTITHTWVDSYPYKSISIFALHPLYIRLSELGVKSAELTRLDRLAEVDYDAVDNEKWRLFRELYARDGERVLGSEPFKQFFDKNRTWLTPYAVFSHLRDRFSTAVFGNWPSPYNLFRDKMMAEVATTEAESIGLYYFLQYHADRQLRMARDATHSVGVVLKGDIPIGVSRDSVEAWSEPHLFNMNGQAGAPPDDFSVDGQNWGFPTYNWDVMAKDGYSWWRARFEKMADYFDMYRIDHILGFFRIWEIPMPQKSGLIGHFSPALAYSAEELSSWGLPMYEERYIGVDDMDPNTLFVRDHVNPRLYHPRIGAQFTDRYLHTLDGYEKERFNALYNHYFYERNDKFWADEAFKKLPALINATSMLCCAEDLGMIPSTVASTLAALDVVTLEIQRMPKDQNMLFGIPAHYPYMSVCTTSSHDMSPIRLWWMEDREKTQRYYTEIMGWHGPAFDEATTDICENIIKQHLNAPSMAAILPFQDWLSVDGSLRADDPASERINIPSDANHYWRYRMHLPVEQLEAEDEFNQRIMGWVEESSRMI